MESSSTDWQKPSCGIAVLISLAWYVCLTCSLFTSLINLTCRHFFNLKSSYGSPFLCKLGLLCGLINTFTTPECMRAEKWNKDMSNWAVLSWEVMHPKEKSTQESVINVTHHPVSFPVEDFLPAPLCDGSVLGTHSPHIMESLSFQPHTRWKLYQVVFLSTFSLRYLFVSLSVPLCCFCTTFPSLTCLAFLF